MSCCAVGVEKDELMGNRFVAACVGVCMLILTALANADDEVPQPSPSRTEANPAPMPANPSPAPAVASKAKVFAISPEQSDHAFMCDGGRIQSVLATAIAEHRPVSITLLDQSKVAIPDNVWTSAYGFRLTHKQYVIISIIMICGQ
jgi:hypothetical protein